MRIRGLLGVVLVVSLGLGCLTWLGRGVNAAREAARRSQCACNLCAISLALHNYHEAHGSFPPAYLTDASGRPAHSWRVLVLPFLEQRALYQAYNFEQPWNGPGNRALLGRMPSTYACPSASPSIGQTCYTVVTGPDTLFPANGESRCLKDISDGAENTLIVVEIDRVPVPWTSPVDLDLRTMSLRVNDPNPPCVSSNHPGGANVLFADGTQRFLHESVEPDHLRALLTPSGGEKVTRRVLDPPNP